jgi:hypothetical protein
MKRICVTILIMFTLFSCLALNAQQQNSAAKNYVPKLNRIFELHELVKEFHPTLEKVYPVAIAEDGQLLIYEPVGQKEYRFVKQVPQLSPVNKGVRAAYPLQENDGKMTCVVTGDVFDALDGYAVIFHEFVHCAQFASVEMNLKQNLEIYKRAVEKKDWMWELNYPFPYSKKEFEEIYSMLLAAINVNDSNKVNELRGKLKQILSPDEYAYLSWVEWKEGFARWVENKIRGKFKLPENHYGHDIPFSRATFYEGGSQYIEFLYRANKKDVFDLERLYSLMK